eukprot:COSAG03_NODE_2404_length_2808_cov_1.382798_3_plen_194_part_00
MQSHTIAAASVAVTATLIRSCNEPNASCSSDGAWRISFRDTDRTGAAARGTECTAPAAVASSGANICVDGGVGLHQLKCHHGVGSVAAGGGGGGGGGAEGAGVGAASTVSVGSSASAGGGGGGGEDASLPSVADAIGASSGMAGLGGGGPLSDIPPSAADAVSQTDSISIPSPSRTTFAENSVSSTCKGMERP